MATIKSFTSLEQSKKLAEILPLESADMTYCAVVEGARDKTTIRGWKIVTGTKKWKVSINAIKNNYFSYRNGYIVPCWSLTALLGVLPKEIVYDKHIVFLEFHVWENSLEYVNNADYSLYVTSSYDNPVDACVDMIEKLHELKML